MSHPRELIWKIRQLLEKEYDPSCHLYTIEQAIKGTRMMPDILVSSAVGVPVCAVEIGYTRPEKLTAYRRELKIPDVRWYDKQGALHGDVQERVLRLEVDLSVRPQTCFGLTYFADQIACFEPECLYWARWSRRLCRLRGGSVDEANDAGYEYQCEDVWSRIITDGIRFTAASSCDKCGHAWFAGHDDVTGWAIADELLCGQLPKGEVQWLGWEEVTVSVKEEFGLELNYLRMDVIDPQRATDLRQQVAVSARQVRERL